MYQNRQSDFDDAAEYDDKPSKKGAKPEFSYSAKLAFLSSVIRHPSMTLAAVRAADVVTDMFNHKLGFCWPSLDTMAERMGMSRSTVKAAVALLVEHGFMTKETSRHKGHQGANHYRPLYAEAATRGQSTGPSADTRGQSTGHQRSDPRPASGQFTGQPEVSPSPPNQDDGTRMMNQTDDNQLATEEAGLSIHEKPDAVAKPMKVRLPDDLVFTAEAVAAARARGLDEGDMASCMSAFRAAMMRDNPDDERTLTTWQKAAGTWLGNQKARAPGTKPRIIPERPRDPSDADGTPYTGTLTLDDASQDFAGRVPEAILRAGTAAFREHYGSEAAAGARSVDWCATWRASVQHVWDIDKANKAASKYPTGRAVV